MPEMIENQTSNVTTTLPPENGMDDIAALLAEQLAASHAAAARCFAMGHDDDFFPAQRDEALRIASRLMHASAAAANAIKRIKGGEFHYRVTVDRIDIEAEKNARREKEFLKENKGKTAIQAIEDKINRIVEEEEKQMTDEERALRAKLFALYEERNKPKSLRPEPKSP